MLDVGCMPSLRQVNHMFMAMLSWLRITHSQSFAEICSPYAYISSPSIYDSTVSPRAGVILDAFFAG